VQVIKKSNTKKEDTYFKASSPVKRIALIKKKGGPFLIFHITLIISGYSFAYILLFITFNLPPVESISANSLYLFPACPLTHFAFMS